MVNAMLGKGIGMDSKEDAFCGSVVSHFNLSTKPLSTSEFITLMQLRLVIFVEEAIWLYWVKHSDDTAGEGQLVERSHYG